MHRWFRHALRYFCVFAAAFSLAQTVTFTHDLLTNDSFSFYTPADFNNDGREDLITACGHGNGNGQFAVNLSTADGIYGAQTCYSIPAGQPFSIAVGDFNGDGSLDLAVVNGTSTIYEYLNNGQGSFHLQTSFVSSAPVLSIATADANHDGAIDLLCTGSEQKLYVYFGNGSGGFRVGPTSTLNVPGRISIGDFDGDGRVDVVSQQSTFTTAVQVAYGDGQGHFLATASFSGNVGYVPSDVDGDGRSDLIGIPFDFSINGNTYYKVVKVLHGNGNRTFTAQDIPLGQCDSGGILPAVADFNGDGVNDIAVVEASDCSGSAPHSVEVLLGKGDGTYQAERTAYSTDVPEPSRLNVMRINRDSKPDMEFFGENDNSGSTVLLTNTTAGKFPKCGPPDSATGFNLCSPTKTVSGSTSVRFSVGAANQTPGRKVELWIDGKKRAENLKGFSHYTFLDATLTLVPGTHRVGIFTAGWDNLVQQYMWTGGPGVTFPLTVQSSTCPGGVGIVVCSPLNEATLTSPVRAWAVGNLNGTTILRMEVWVDGVKKFSTFGSKTLDTKLDLPAGVHRLTYYLLGTNGSKTSATVVATVRE